MIDTPSTFSFLPSSIQWPRRGHCCGSKVKSSVKPNSRYNRASTGDYSISGTFDRLDAYNVCALLFTLWPSTTTGEIRQQRYGDNRTTLQRDTMVRFPSRKVSFWRSGSAVITSTQLCYVERGEYWDWWRPLAGLPSRYLSRPLSLAIPSWVGAMNTRNGFGYLRE